MYSVPQTSLTLPAGVGRRLNEGLGRTARQEGGDVFGDLTVYMWIRFLLDCRLGAPRHLDELVSLCRRRGPVPPFDSHR